MDLSPAEAPRRNGAALGEILPVGGPTATVVPTAAPRPEETPRPRIAAAAGTSISSWHPAGGRVYLAVKRAVDVTVASIGLVLLLPMMLLAAALVKLTDGGPATYPHTRVGLRGREFRCYKFRTMVLNADQMKDELGELNHHDDDRTFKVPNDPRVTPVGKWLRLSSFDEVLQLWNVVQGDMSLVGPRPPVPSEVAQYDAADMRRLEVKPGLTCTWQVSGRSNIPFSRQLQLDLEYIEQRCLWLDLKLLLRTIPAVIRGDGAY